jgi:hypothetical protein
MALRCEFRWVVVVFCVGQEKRENLGHFAVGIKKGQAKPDPFLRVLCFALPPSRRFL